MSNLTEALKRKIEEILDDLDLIEDLSVSDTDDPDVIDIIIRGRLKEEAFDKQKQDPASDYDRAMKGLSPCEDTSQSSTLTN
jgi:hypothetical protein